MRRLALLACLFALAAPAAAQMPDPRAMSGMSMPSAELPDGSVSVRVVRGQITNNLEGVTVELQGAGEVRSAKTGADGRAVFSGLLPGTTVRAIATVDGERLESQPIEVPVKGGMRTLLAASDTAGEGSAAPAPAAPAAGAPAPPAQAGSADVSALSLGAGSRVATEFSEDVLQVFYLLEIVNTSSSPVTLASALVFDMPTGAEGTSILDGSTPQANAKGPRVTVTGPFPPGATPVHMAFRIDTFGGSLTLEQRFPLPLDAVSIAVQRVGGLKVSSPQVERTTESAIDKSVFVMGNGPRLEAGRPLTLNLTGLPHHSRTPVHAALGLVALIIACAGWLAFAPGRADAAAARRQELETRREQGLAALAALEQKHRTRAIDEAQYEHRRSSLVAQLERIYGELDADGGTPGGQGVAA